MSSLSPVPRPVLGVLALASVLALSACGGEQPERTGTAGTPSVSGSVSPAPAAAPAESAAGEDTGNDTGDTAGTADERAGEQATAEPAGTPAPADGPTDSPGAQGPTDDPAEKSTASGDPAEDGTTSAGPAAGDAAGAGGAAGGAGSRADWCATPALDVSAAPAGGAAGSVYVDVTVTNAAEEPCVLGGYPGVSFVDAAGTAIGVPAVRDAGVPGTGRVLAPGESATAVLRMSRAGNHAACDAREAAGLRVYPPESTESVVVPFPAEACTGPGIQQLEIQGFGA